VNDPLDDDTSTTAFKRGGIIQPQATGQQKRSNIGSGAASSSVGHHKHRTRRDSQVLKQRVLRTMVKSQDALGRKVRRQRYLRHRLLVPPPLRNQRRDLPGVAMVVAEPRMYLSHNRPRTMFRTLPTQKVSPLPTQLDRRQPSPRRRLPESQSQPIRISEFVEKRNEKSANVDKQLHMMEEPLRLEHRHVQEYHLPAHGQRGRRAAEAQVVELSRGSDVQMPIAGEPTRSRSRASSTDAIDRSTADVDMEGPWSSPAEVDVGGLD
jgi:hypothetical protein